MITFPRGFSIISFIKGLVVITGLSLKTFSSTVDITLLAALVPIFDPTLLTPAFNAFVPNFVAVSLTNLDVNPYKILLNIPAPLKASTYSYIPAFSLYLFVSLFII